ncbi:MULTISPECIES: flagellar hook-basal body protein [Paenibacillus]|uniref:flagellar hook-basal body protein n=1 Tax=Paenibacillus TaxID=44249 RepID=UPI0004134A59|nr:flagellar hook-basal body protein [Paenibacillus massiliensis]
MNNSMIGAMVTMSSAQQRLDMIANNVANVNTVGFKKDEGSFQDVLSRVQQQPETYRQTGRAMPLGYNLGFGVKMASMTKDLEQGSMLETGNPTDLAIVGNALFAIDANGEKAWTRNGGFSFVPDPANPQGNEVLLVTADGHRVLDRTGNEITAPVGSKVAIDEQGRVIIRIEGEEDYSLQEIQFVNVQRYQGLELRDGNMFVLGTGVTEDDVFGAGAAATIPDNAKIRQGVLEQSNVNLTEEMTTMLQTQRMYQMASRALTSSDTMMGLANSLRA